MEGMGRANAGGIQRQIQRMERHAFVAARRICHIRRTKTKTRGMPTRFS